MKLVRCDRCGCDLEEEAGRYEFTLIGSYPIDYQDRYGDYRRSRRIVYDLCTDCALAIVAEIERNKKEGQHV